MGDALLLAALPFVEYALRFDGFAWSAADWSTFWIYLVGSVGFKLAIFIVFGLYTRLWTQAGFRDLERVAVAALVSAVACSTFSILLPDLNIAPIRVPLLVLALDAVATLVLITATRMAARFLNRPRPLPAPAEGERATIIAGAGKAGRAVAEELQAHPEWGLKLVGFVDDDPTKQRRLLVGHRVLGSLRDLPALLAKYRVGELIIAMPGARGTVIRRLVTAANAAGTHTRTVPSLYELISERVNVTALRQVEIRDLLRRDPVETDLAVVRATVADRTVLVTGAGGSIGSELCRQIAPLGPRRLLLLGHGENSIFDIQNTLRESHPGLELVPIIADVRDRQHVLQVFAQHLPEVVYHAAAHKHVPLMEANIAEAVLNNVAGTDNLVEGAVTFGVDHFVLISTDKAVRPCSVMGATKRIAEMLVQHAGSTLGRNFVVVRLGNVLASRGSVVPLFLRQIQAGGPVMVTHPEMQRYFMTIPEAVQLVLQAGAQGSNGNVFVLDMGKPVRIVDLASDLIRLSGLEPHVDIEIRYSGTRPGERLFEEILFSGESVTPTAHPKVLRATDVHLTERLRSRVSRLVDAAWARRPDATLRQLIEEAAPDAHLAERSEPGQASPEPAVVPGASTRLATAGPDAGV
jgi:FlaA1/EpsC-like NDP-sugar epimerase